MCPVWNNAMKAVNRRDDAYKPITNCLWQTRCDEYFERRAADFETLLSWRKEERSGLIDGLSARYNR